MYIFIFFFSIDNDLFSILLLLLLYLFHDLKSLACFLGPTLHTNFSLVSLSDFPSLSLPLLAISNPLVIRVILSTPIIKYILVKKIQDRDSNYLIHILFFTKKKTKKPVYNR